LNIKPGIFREYDIRGVVGVDFDADFAHLLGRAYATKLLAAGIGKASIGRDCRLTSPSLAAALKEGMLATGLDVVDVGMCPTPLLYFSVFHLEIAAGIMVTGSHNPPDHNGFKIMVGKTTIHGEEVQELRALMEAGEFPDGEGVEETYPIIPAYIGFCEEHFGRVAEGIKVIVDSGNGTAGPVAPEVFRNMGAEVIELYSEPDGTFPNHHPDPAVEENVAELIAKVRETGAALGIAFDGDSDRIGLIDDASRIIWGDEMLVVFARDILAREPGISVVSEVKCSQRLYDDIEAHGGTGIMWKAGHSLLKAKMRETGAKLGGEMSGHIFFADRYYGFDDAIYAGARMLEIIAKSEQPLSEMLSDLPVTVFTPEIRVECADDIKFELAARATARFRELGYDLIDIDGVRVQFEKGWGLIRASNTQPVLVMRFEASDEETLAEYRSIVEKELDALRTELGVA
jgi:phosphomannomutase/phosphoglucomutase